MPLCPTSAAEQSGYFEDQICQQCGRKIKKIWLPYGLAGGVFCKGCKKAKAQANGSGMTTSLPEDVVESGAAEYETAARDYKLAYNLNDAGNGERLIHRYGRDLRWCPERGFMVWTGTYWKHDELAVERFAEATLQQFVRAATHDPGNRETELKFLTRSLSQTGIKNMCGAARRKAIEESITAFDAKPELLAVQNGTIDLRTATLRKHRREDLITRVTPVTFDPEAQCPVFTAFLERILPAKELRDYLQRAIGCAATGKPEKVLFFLTGTPNGNNGKTTLLEAIRTVLGPYAGQVEIDSLLEKSKGFSNVIALADIATSSAAGSPRLANRPREHV
jgi:phage/plasmid-associated DNA primase